MTHPFIILTTQRTKSTALLDIFHQNINSRIKNPLEYGQDTRLFEEFKDQIEIAYYGENNDIPNIKKKPLFLEYSKAMIKNDYMKVMYDQIEESADFSNVKVIHLIRNANDTARSQINAIETEIYFDDGITKYNYPDENDENVIEREKKILNEQDYWREKLINDNIKHIEICSDDMFDNNTLNEKHKKIIENFLDIKIENTQTNIKKKNHN
jgi:hypothetical protein